VIANWWISCFYRFHTLSQRRAKCPSCSLWWSYNIIHIEASYLCNDWILQQPYHRFSVDDWICCNNLPSKPSYLNFQQHCPVLRSKPQMIPVSSLIRYYKSEFVAAARPDISNSATRRIGSSFEVVRSCKKRVWNGAVNCFPDSTIKWSILLKTH